MESLNTRVKEVFDILDTEKSGCVDIKQLSRGVRAVGLNPSEADIRTLLSEIQTNEDGDMDFREFKRICERCKSITVTNKEDVTAYFRSFQQQTEGVINTQELKQALMTSGQPLQEHEIDAVLKDFEADGKVRIDQLVEGLFS